MTQISPIKLEKKTLSGNPNDDRSTTTVQWKDDCLKGLSASTTKAMQREFENLGVLTSGGCFSETTKRSTTKN